MLPPGLKIAIMYGLANEDGTQGGDDDCDGLFLAEDSGGFFFVLGQLLGGHFPSLILRGLAGGFLVSRYRVYWNGLDARQGKVRLG